jgi:integrase
MNALRRHKARQAQDQLALGPSYDRALDLVCARPDGEPWKLSIVTRAFKYIAERLRKEGYPRVTFHGLRHSRATILFHLGEQPKVVQDRMGHATISVTYDIYAHAIAGMQDAAADKVEAALS